MPVTEFSVQVPASRLEEAKSVLAAAQAAGPAAAEQAEREGELAGLPAYCRNSSFPPQPLAVSENRDQPVLIGSIGEDMALS